MGRQTDFFAHHVLVGLATVATAFVTSVSHLITLRLLLGAFEAGFLPGIILYLTFWFPSSMRARVTAVIFVANAVAGSIASPLSGWIITYMDGVGGLSGWKWVFVVEGAPACLLGILCFFVLRDRPDDATWLTDDEKRLVKEDLAKDEIPEEQHSKGVMRNILCNPVNYLVAYLFFTAACSNYLLFFWLPTIVKDSGVNSLVDVGFLSAIPLLFGFVGAIALSWSSDVLRERRWHLVFCFGLISFGLVAGTIAQTLPWMLFFFAVASFGTGASGPLIWSLPPGYLDRKSAPLGIAFISTLGNVAGFVSPPILGYIKTVTGSLNLGIIGIAMLGLTGAVLTLFALSPAVVRVKKSIDSPSVV